MEAALFKPTELAPFVPMALSNPLLQRTPDGAAERKR
jgi:hypothetical protein